MSRASQAALRRAIRRWMDGNVEDHLDPMTGEVNLTPLVENWDRTCSTGEATLDPNHPAWEIAVHVAEAYARRREQEDS